MVSRGLEGIIANTTRLSDVIGDKGQLIYCGYDINELAGKVSYEEVVFLLWNNRLPNRAELEKCANQLRSERELPGGVVDFLRSAPKTSNPMDVIRTAVSMLGLHDPDNRQRVLRNTQRVGAVLSALGAEYLVVIDRMVPERERSRRIGLRLEAEV